ncbi:MAG: hypothetical protein OXR82_19475 [Gammaproteobacteria bacterium]|nr:hypothetical protein [Gammaproteobacteria bacterium]MDE0260554.1 hypothetical protein [Gammaproteobacteria bacterium]
MGLGGCLAFDTPRLMVELGTPPEDAISRVRESRSWRAIETAEQEAHVRSCRALAE